LACSLVDIESWIIPLEVCWVVSLVGIASSAAAPHPWIPKVSPALGAMSLGAVGGLGIALLLLHYGLIQRSFIDADEKPHEETEKPASQSKKKTEKTKSAPTSVAITRKHGVNPRIEILRELVFLSPAVVLGVVGYVLVTRVPVVSDAWGTVTGGGMFAKHFNAFLAALFGYLVGGLWIWGMRIGGTLAFGKEAMGMGDVHLLGGVGAVCGWVVPSIAFFIAPLFGLLWALYLWVTRDQRELPYGPWLAVASLVVLLFYDAFNAMLSPYTDLFGF
ncbi:MAG: A24 family peptidase, partial [Planctomycetota bacterium]